VPYDPLRLCIFATIALIAWVAGPFAVVFFAGLGFAGYLRARRSGLLRSRCKLGDTRIVLAYLAVLVVAGLSVVAIVNGHVPWWLIPFGGFVAVRLAARRHAYRGAPARRPQLR
jgi:hypothetical protein